MNCQFYIYTANHGKRAGIEDYVTLLKNALGSRGYKVEASETLRKDATNIIIDEFTNVLENERIVAFREKNPDSKYVFILTEFRESKYGVESFNHFGGLFDSAVIALFNVYFRLRRDDFLPIRIRDIAVLLLYSPLLAAYFMATFARHFVFRLAGRSNEGPLANFARCYHRLIYFHMRYLGLEAHLRYADAVIASHELIREGFRAPSNATKAKFKYLGVIYPEFDEKRVLRTLMANKKPYVEITGSITPYRRKWINRLNFYLMRQGLISAFGQCKVIPFSSSEELQDRGAYSLHPPQSRNWLYCSPTRIYRALEVDHSMPVLTKYFAQSPIEDVCLIFKDQTSVVEMIKMYNDKKTLLDLVGPRISKYNDIVRHRNDLVVRLLLEISRCTPRYSKRHESSTPDV